MTRAHASARRLAAARTLSIVGHPGLLVPGAVASGIARADAPVPGLWLAGVAAALLVGCVLLYSLVQVRAGRWSHVDASAPRERAQLTAFLVPLLAGTALALWAAGLPATAGAAPAFGAAMVGGGHAGPRRLGRGPPAGGAGYAAALAGPWWVTALAGAVLAGGVAWSRVVLRRHTRAEAWLGLLLGAAAGAGFHAVALATAWG